MIDLTLQTASGLTQLRQREGQGTPVFYLAGHRNIFESPKGSLLEDICVRQNIPLTHFAYYGWEQSATHDIPASGEGYIRHWLTQTLEVFDHIAREPQILVGYSMGGILMLALAQLRPHLIHSVIGLAAGFGKNGQAKASAIYGNSSFVALDGQKPLTFTPREDTEMLFPSPIECQAPLHLLNGLQDEWVSWKNAVNIAQAWAGNNVSITLNKISTHRLDDAFSMKWLEDKLLTK